MIKTIGEKICIIKITYPPLDEGIHPLLYREMLRILTEEFDRIDSPQYVFYSKDYHSLEIYAVNDFVSPSEPANISGALDKATYIELPGGTHFNMKYLVEFNYGTNVIIQQEEKKGA